MSPSYNHSYLAYRIAKLLDQSEKYSIHIEMTMDIDGTDYVPDIALCEKRQIDFLHDRIKTAEPPVLVVKILSPKQAVNEITEKFEIYLQAGVKSCWLVIPPTKTIVVFHDINQPRSYSNGSLNDPAADVEVSLEAVFS